MTTILRTQQTGTIQFPPIPFTRLLRAEWQKTTSTRAARWLLAATAVITIGALLIPLLFPHDVPQSRASYLTWAGVGLTRLLPVVLMLAMTAEWSQRTAMTTFTQEPRRGRVMTAKILTGQAIGLRRHGLRVPGRPGDGDGRSRRGPRHRHRLELAAAGRPRRVRAAHHHHRHRVRGTAA